MARELKHTPGPWHRRIGRKGDGDAISQHEQLCNHDGVAALIIQHDGSDEGNANAILIAVSPEMLDTLQEFQEFIRWILNEDGAPDLMAICERASMLNENLWRLLIKATQA